MNQPGGGSGGEYAHPCKFNFDHHCESIYAGARAGEGGGGGKEKIYIKKVPVQRNAQLLRILRA